MSPAARATLRVALRHCRQWNAFRRALTAWRSVYDRLDSASVADPMETLH
jgi:hypothetical protein